MVKKPPANAGEVRDADLIPEWGRPPEEVMAAHSVFLPGESHGQSSLAGYNPWSHKEWDTTEAT